MKKSYKKISYILDDGILLYGYRDKYGFHPESFGAGFTTQKMSPKKFKSIAFSSVKEAITTHGPLFVVGGCEIIGVDEGFYMVKYMGCNCGNVYIGSVLTEEVEDVKMAICIYLYECGYKGCDDVKINLYYESASGNQIDSCKIENMVYKDCYYSFSIKVWRPADKEVFSHVYF